MTGTGTSPKTAEKSNYSSVKELRADSPFHNNVIEAGFLNMTRSESNAERRNTQRFKICWDVTVNGIDQSGKLFGEEGVLADLSSRGAFIYLTRRLNRGDRMEVQIKIPVKTENWIKYMSAEIVRLEETRDLTGVAVRFDTTVPVFIVQ